MEQSVCIPQTKLFEQRNFDENFIVERKEKLGEYLLKLTQNQSLCKENFFQEFLGLNSKKNFLFFFLLK